MPRKSKSRANDSVRELLHGGKPVPQGLMRQHVRDLKRKFETRFKEKSALQQQAQKYLAEAQSSSGEPAPEGSEATKALNGLRLIAEQLAKRKLTILPHVNGAGGILSGHYSLNMVPPYDYSDFSANVDFGNPTVSASADESSGEMRSSVATDFKAKSGGDTFTALGIYFYPRFQNGTLRASVNPSFIFSWWANSLSSLPMVQVANTLAYGAFGITAYSGSTIVAQNAQDFSLWQEFIARDLQFDFGSKNESLAAQMNVDGEHSYVISLCCYSIAQAGGWPGSLAGATLNTSLPSITVDVEIGLPLENA
jgi:hypothetical protein